MRDVVVIGGGPAGSLAARRLAEQGNDVVLLEEHPGVGMPSHCTGLLGEDAFVEFDLPRSLILGEARSACFWGTREQSVRIASDRAAATVIDRVALDQLLAARAREAGVELRLGSRVESIEVAAGSVRVRIAGTHHSVEARACVLACGANYRFHRRLGLGLPALFLQSAQLEAPFPLPPDPGVQVSFGRELAPAGFAWLVPLRRDGVPFARIGLMSETRSRLRFKAFIDKLAERAGVNPSDLPLPRLKVLPLAPVRRTYGDRLLAIGDAAGLVKPTTGGGIYYGLISGAIAARVLDEGLRRDRLHADELRRYESSWQRRLGREIRIGLTFRRIAAQLTDESIESLIELARVNGIVPLLQQKASFNWHRKAAVALLAHPSFRRIVFQSFARGSGRP